MNVRGEEMKSAFLPLSVAVMWLVVGILFGIPWYTSGVGEWYILLATFVAVSLLSLRAFVLMNKKDIYPYFKWIQLICTGLPFPIIFLLEFVSNNNFHIIITAIIAWGISELVLLSFAIYRAHVKNV
jgi:hypothetical protein